MSSFDSTQPVAADTAGTGPRSPRGPVQGGERALAPDLARGFMLLLIAIANTPWYLWGRDYTISSIHPPDGTWWDRSTQLVIITTADARVYPMFAFLFGYGMVQLLLRQTASGVSERSAVALLHRRNLWLLVFGFVHAALLFMGDILGAYGLAGLVLAALFLRRRDRTLLVWSAVLTGLLVLFLAFSALGAYATAALGKPAEQGFSPYGMAESLMSEPNYLVSVLERLQFWPLLSVGQGLGLAVPIAILLGFWAARRRVLEEPERHLRLLGWTATLGITVGWLGGLPHALTHVGIVPFPEDAMFVFNALMLPTGVAGGVGYVAVFGLIGYWLRNRSRSGGVSTALAAVGKRSLSCYLAQSVLCAPLLAAWGLGLGAHLHSASMAAFAIGVWLVTVAGAYLLERAGRRGPAEVLLRRLSYRNAPTASQ